MKDEQEFLAGACPCPCGDLAGYKKTSDLVKNHKSSDNKSLCRPAFTFEC